MCLIKKLREKDEDAYKYLLDKYGNVFLYMSNKVLHNYEDSIDCVQEIYMRIYNYIDKSPTKENELIPWIFKIAKTQIIDYHRKMNKNKGIVFNNDDFVYKIAIPISPKTCESEILDELQEFLSEEEYEMLTYHIVAKMTYKEIGIILNLPSHTARRRVQAVFTKSKEFVERRKKELYEK